MDMKNTGICSLISFMGGLLVGSIATMLTAPQSGAELRTKIRELIEQEGEKLHSHCQAK